MWLAHDKPQLLVMSTYCSVRSYFEILHCGAVAISQLIQITHSFDDQLYVAVIFQVQMSYIGRFQVL